MNGGAKPEANSNALLSVGDLAELAGVSKTSIRREISRGTLPAVHVGRLVRVRRDDWLLYLDSHRVRGRLMPVPTTKRRADIAGAAARHLE
jgi:excisionase family DNA binding protein